MGRVLVAARLENLEDVYKAAQVALPADRVRAVDVTDALIDTGATGLWVPRRLIAQLGLSVLRTRPARTIAGNVDVSIYRAVRLTIQGRDCISDVGGDWRRVPCDHRASAARVDGLGGRSQAAAADWQPRTRRRADD